MKLKISSTTRLKGTATPPSSKSHSVRALILATLARGTSHLKNILDADDAHAAIEVCKNLGAKIKITKNISGGLDLEVQSDGIPLNTSASKLFSGNSGITTTFIVPTIGLRKKSDAIVTLSCGEQMQKRPLKSIIDAVEMLGMNVKSTNNNCPLELSGNLIGGNVTVDGTNSQYLSALLLNLPCAQKNSEIHVKDLRERPFVEMTLSWLEQQGIRYGHFKKDNVDTFKIFGNQEYKPFTKTIPGDFSSASYLIAAAVLLPSEVTLHGLDMNDPQGDKKIIPLLQQMGADIQIDSANQALKIVGGKPLKGTTIDCADFPDMFPTLAVIATQAEGKTSLINAKSVRIKETDRIKSMATELAKMGAQLEEREASLIIHHSKLYHTQLHGYNDHRTIMALAIAALLASPNRKGEEQTTIDTAESISKTFPNFATMMQPLTIRREATPTLVISN